MPQSGRGKMIFPPRHTDWWKFGEGVPITSVSGKKLRICAAPTGRDVWRFSFRLLGTYSDSAKNTSPCVQKPAGMHCYTFDQASVELSQNHTCQDWTLP